VGALVFAMLFIVDRCALSLFCPARQIIVSSCSFRTMVRCRTTYGIMIVKMKPYVAGEMRKRRGKNQVEEVARML